MFHHGRNEAGRLFVPLFFAACRGKLCVDDEMSQQDSSFEMQKKERQ